MPVIIQNKDYINIMRSSRLSNSNIDTNCIFFEDADYFSFIYNEYLKQLKIIKHRLQVPPKARKKTISKVDKRVKFSTSFNLPLGKYYFDTEESNDDIAIIYFE